MKRANPIRHDLRVTAKFPIQTHVTTLGAGRWAQGIIERYLGRFWAGQALNTHWRRVQREPAESPRDQQIQVFAPTQLTFAPSVQLTLLTHRIGGWPPGGTQAALSGAPVSGWQASRQPISAPQVQLLLQRLHARAQLEGIVTQQLTQPLVTRHQRMEVLETAHSAGKRLPTSANKGEFWPQAPVSPVPRIVHKAVAAPANPETAVSPTPWPRGSAIAAKPMTMHTQPANGHTVDINRLTDQVMQQIDRRLLAHRERTGRA